MENVFVVEQEKFKGPLELLLELIEKRKLLINDISLSKVADDFISYTQKIDSFPVSESANFILIASTLVLIKSKSLLPTIELTEEEQGDIKNLERRLVELKKIKELSLHIEKMFGKKIMFPRQSNRIIESVFSPTQEISTVSIKEALQKMLSSITKPQKMSEAVVKKVISLEEAIQSLVKRVQTNLKMTFKDFSKSNHENNADYKEMKINLVVSFLAMLELVKQGIIQVTQNNEFGDIEMENREVDVPKYGM